MPATTPEPDKSHNYYLLVRAKQLPNVGREKAEAAAVAVGGTVPLPGPSADQVAKGTDWNDYEASHGRAVTQAALRMAGLRELTAQGLPVVRTLKRRGQKGA